MIKTKQILRGLIKFFFISFLFGVLLTLIVPFLSNSCRKKSNIEKFDVIIVLGNPATDDCKPGLVMENRVTKGIELLRSGIAKKILFTGSSVMNNCTEAEVMAAYAVLNGVSKADILEENRAKNTFQNAYYSIEQMKKLNFTSAAIVTSEPHLKRACAVFAKFDIVYTMFPSNNPKNISKLQLLLWKFGERMILTHHIIFGYPK